MMTDSDHLQQIAHLRREYTRGGLRRKDLPEDPLSLFEHWLNQAVEAQLPDPTAMSVATVDKQGQPYQRIVLLKHFDAQGMVFYTNLGSRKAKQLESNPRISLLFPWHMLERQVMVLGRVEGLSTLEVLKYFHSRPRDSQLGVPASDGSDYLKTIPGFAQIRNGGTNGDPVFRGMFGSRMRIMTDGGEMPGACPARMDAPSSYISPESYDLLSIIKGPQTVIWGPGNSAGTVRFDREPHRFDQSGIQGNASLLGASNNRWDQNADLSVGSEQGYLRVIGNHSISQDYKDGKGDRVLSRWNKWNSDLALGWTSDKDTLVELTAGRGNGKARYAGRSMDGSQFKRESLSMRVEKSNLGEVFDKLEAQMYYNYANHIMDNYSLRSSGSMPGMSTHMDMSMPMAMQLDRRTVGGRFMGTWLWSDFELKSGMDMQTSSHRNHWDNDWRKDARFHDIGAFGELSWSVDPHNKLVSGARLERSWVDNFSASDEGARSDTMPAGFMRLEHTLDSLPLMMYAGVGYTERFPDYWELFSPSYFVGGRSTAFETVKSEKTTQLDIGAKYSGKRMDGWVSAYLGHVRDFILFSHDPNDAYVSRADDVNATIMGGEAGLSYKLTESLTADFA